jgi:DNA-binding LacI/PurR family transcriptional regulator
VRKCITKALASKEKPTAFVVNDPVHALATVTTILMHGLRIPQDIAVVARMSDPVLELIQPKVSTYRFDGVKLGRGVASMVLSLIRKGSITRRHRLILPERVRGETLGPASDAACA